ncbi:hypothetical protein CCR75_008901 [Bremia lactucae]|uniref:Uncharacterized protein n=1 Tax=Bremia lactucae TaxID=4779 RepID=A0A976IDQ7_BRELC|nr:hypothetical protein CCR75_008901 [Bremia lactucae]
MAKRKFVSSKKNAPSRTLSSKEAALHRRIAGENDASSDSGDSAPSSDVGSSTLLSSEEEQEDVDVDINLNKDVTVELMPASVGRGKQLRFPTAISRGKVLPTEGGAASDADDSDDESLLSVADSEDEDEDRKATAAEHENRCIVATPLVNIGSLPATHNFKSCSKVIPSYPIKATRARKRHRPDSDYCKQMSTYVQTCLLSVRHPGNSNIPANTLTDEGNSEHDEFRRLLSTGDVERIKWIEPPSKESQNVGLQKDEDSSDKLINSNKDTDTSKSLKSSKHSKVSKSSKNKRKSEAPTSDLTDLSANKSFLSLNGTIFHHASSAPTAPSVAPNASAVCEVCKARLCEELAREKETKQAIKTERGVESEKDVKADGNIHQPEKVKTELVQSNVLPVPPGNFTIIFSSGTDVQKLRLESAKLMEEARKLKHEGNHRGSSESGTVGQLTQGIYYLRSGAKFFEYALKLQEVKLAYQEKNDAQHAHSFGENCVTTLSQTTSLIESTIRVFQGAGSMRLAALGCKMASVVHLTVYRLQHRKLQSFYTELFAPGRSPECRENGLTPPIDQNSNGTSKDAAIRKHLLKEMEHTLRGFELWRRYEACKVDVMPRVTNPVILDLATFFEDLKTELDQV